VLTNGFTKGALFLSAGNIHRAFGSKLATEVQGAFGRTPVSAGLFLAGFFAVTGAPPFGPFVSELVILQAALDRPAIVAAFLLFALVIFVGMGSTVLQVVQGPTPPRETPFRDSPTLPIFGFLGVSLLLGVWMPEPLRDQLALAAAYVEGR
jgi:hydrogenase-4 component F